MNPPTSIDEVVEELVRESRSLFDDAIRIPRETHYTNRVAECQKILRTKLLTLVEQARQDGVLEGEMNEAVKRYDQAKEDGTLDKHFPVLGSARTISSDKK